jgi:hypothetical protein
MLKIGMVALTSQTPFGIRFSKLEVDQDRIANQILAPEFPDAAKLAQCR